MSTLKTYIDDYKDILDFIPEELRPIYLDGTKSNYMISNRGYVISYYNKQKPRKLKNNITKNGYCMVCLYHNDKEYWKYVHRLVAEAFIEIPKEYIEQGFNFDDLEVNHKNGTLEGKSDNSITNLEWATSSDNKIHAYKNDLKKRGELSPCSIYSDNQIHMVCKLLEEDEVGLREIWNRTGVSVNTISAILSGNQWKHISEKYNFSNHTKRRVLYPESVKNEALKLLKTTTLSLKEIGDKVGMTRNAVWFLREKYM